MAGAHCPISRVYDTISTDLGLNVFVAVIGIEAAPSFISGIKEVGPMLLVVGAIGTSLPLLFGLWLGHKIFKFHPAITLGCWLTGMSPNIMVTAPMTPPMKMASPTNIRSSAMRPTRIHSAGPRADRTGGIGRETAVISA